MLSNGKTTSRPMAMWWSRKCCDLTWVGWSESVRYEPIFGFTGIFVARQALSGRYRTIRISNTTKPITAARGIR